MPAPSPLLLIVGVLCLIGLAVDQFFALGVF